MILSTRCRSWECFEVSLNLLFSISIGIPERPPVFPDDIILAFLSNSDTSNCGTSLVNSSSSITELKASKMILTLGESIRLKSVTRASEKNNVSMITLVDIIQDLSQSVIWASLVKVTSIMEVASPLMKVEVSPELARTSPRLAAKSERSSGNLGLL